MYLYINNMTMNTKTTMEIIRESILEKNKKEDEIMEKIYNVLNILNNDENFISKCYDENLGKFCNIIPFDSMYHNHEDYNIIIGWYFCKNYNVFKISPVGHSSKSSYIFDFKDDITDNTKKYISYYIFAKQLLIRQICRFSIMNNIAIFQLESVVIKIPNENSAEYNEILQLIDEIEYLKNPETNFNPYETILK